MRVIVAILVCAMGAGASAQTDIFYMSAGDQNIVAGVQGGVQVTRFSSSLMGYPIAVSDGEVRICNTSAGGAAGRAFDLSGVFLRGLQVRGGSTVFDATSDGVFNYFYTSGSIYRSDLDWGNATPIFAAPGDIHGIAYDPINDSLWHVNGTIITEYSLTGTLRSSFNTVIGNNCGLAWEPSSDSLWTYAQGSNTFRQYSKAGALLATVPFANPFADNFIGGEFEYRTGAGLPRCSITAPAAGVTVGADVSVVWDGLAPMMVTSLDASFEFSTDAGATWAAATAAAASPLPNPATALPAPVMGATFVWDSLADGVGVALVAATRLRVTVDDGTTTAACTVDVMVDNVPPPVACTLSLPGGTLRGAIDATLDATSTSSATVTAVLSYSTDGGTTFAFATMTPASAHTNPDIVATGLSVFQWDSRADGVALGGLVAGVILRAEVDDLVAPMGATCDDTADIDNTMLCGLTCGDCDLNGAGPSILDALVAAQIAVGAVVATPPQVACCDVDVSGTLTIIDALLIAQSAAGLPVMLMCV